MRRIELGYGLSITGELAGTVALVVYALGAGGAALVAAYAASRTVAGMGVALVLTGLTSRLRRDRLLRWITAVRMVLLAAAALLAASDQPPAVIAAGAASSALAGTYRPLQAAVLPWLVRTPAELAASNAVTAVMENSGALIGPLLAGGLLAVAAPAAAMAAAAGILAAATVSLLRLTVPDTPKLAGRHRMADSAVTLVDTPAGRTLTVADIAADPLLSPEESAAYAWLGIATLCRLPLLEGSRFAANLNVYACRPRQRTDNARRDSEEQLRTVADTAPASDRRPGVPPDHRVRGG